jgi:hypothetical protein
MKKDAPLKIKGLKRLPMKKETSLKAKGDKKDLCSEGYGLHFKRPSSERT